MDLSDPLDRERWFDHLAGLVAGRKVVCGLGPLAALTEFVELLARAGAEKPLLLYTSRGAGPVPDEADVFLLQVATPRYETLSEEVRDQERVLRSASPEVLEALDRYDPAREALRMVGPFASTDPVDGRPVIGGRERAWAALEDKIVVDEIWDAVGYPRSERRIVDVSSLADLEDASRRLDEGHGVVWVADAREGMNGGGEFTRWVATPDDLTAAVEFFRAHCDRVRVMPFLDGVPCSIHGIVLPDGTLALRPVELAIMRDSQRRFLFGGLGTTWDPPRADREQMRDLVRRTGEHLRERVGYRGGFGIDGVMTADGFRPTELNPRYSGGLVTIGHVLDSALFQLLQLNLAAGRDPGVTVAELEAWAVPALDLARTAQPKAVLRGGLVEDRTRFRATWDGRRLRADDAGELEVLVAPTPSGTFAKIDADGLLGAGERVGPLNAAMMRLLDAELDAGIGPVEAAPDVRRLAAPSDVPGSDGEQGEDHDGDVRDDLPDADLLRAEPASG